MLLFSPGSFTSQFQGIVTLVDAKHLILHLDEEKPEGVENEAVEQARRGRRDWPGAGVEDHSDWCESSPFVGFRWF